LILGLSFGFGGACFSTEDEELLSLSFELFELEVFLYFFFLPLFFFFSKSTKSWFLLVKD